MKAIHNIIKILINWFKVVLYPKDTENESNSQLKIIFILLSPIVVLYPKDTENESNSQHQVLKRFY